SSGRGLPKLNRSEAQIKATAFLNQVLPKYSGSLAIDPDATSDPYLGLRNTGATAYSFTFDRMVNGIPFTENAANIQVDAHSGAVNSFNFNWDGTIVFPGAEGLLQPGQAESLWRINAQAQLGYFTPISDGKLPDAARLLYAPKDSGLMIDARSGEILKPGDNNDQRGYKMINGGGGMSSVAQAAPLTPAEQAALTELGKLISQDQALKTARSLVEIPAGFVLQSSNLQLDYLTGGRVWNFCWYDPNEQGSLFVQVDASQNRLASYNLMTAQQDQSQPPRLNEDQARDLAAGFLSTAAGDLQAQMDKLRLVPTAPIRPLAGKQAPPPTSFSFTADRLVKGIPFSGNGVSLTVDAVQGKVASYMLNWWQLKFPEAHGVIGQERAENAFLAGGALALSYRREFSAPIQAPGQVMPVRLVYALMPKAPYYVDAFTGLGLDGDFQTKINLEQQVFTDLAGVPGAEAANALAGAKIIPVYDSSFHPAAALSQRDWLIWLVRASGWQSTPAADPDQEFKKDYQQAFSLGILKAGEQYLPEDDLDQVTMARMVVRALGWDEVAGFQGIWSPLPAPPGGASKVAAADQGYLALAAGLGIIDRNGKEFDPSAGLTRLEGAVALNKILN
ncbi:MAG: YcdB/YcdC domain-containing protein, partial [Thermacetogeniaceae bacterium]